MENYSYSELKRDFPQQYQCGYDVGVPPGLTENDVIAVDRVGACVVSEVSRSDNGDVIATVSDTSTDEAAPYSFLKYSIRHSVCC